QNRVTSECYSCKHARHSDRLALIHDHWHLPFPKGPLCDHLRNRALPLLLASWFCPDDAQCRPVRSRQVARCMCWGDQRVLCTVPVAGPVVLDRVGSEHVSPPRILSPLIISQLSPLPRIVSCDLI